MPFFFAGTWGSPQDQLPAPPTNAIHNYGSADSDSSTHSGSSCPRRSSISGDIPWFMSTATASHETKNSTHKGHTGVDPIVRPWFLPDPEDKACNLHTPVSEVNAGMASNGFLEGARKLLASPTKKETKSRTQEAKPWSKEAKNHSLSPVPKAQTVVHGPRSLDARADRRRCSSQGNGRHQRITFADTCSDPDMASHNRLQLFDTTSPPVSISKGKRRASSPPYQLERVLSAGLTVERSKTSPILAEQSFSSMRMQTKRFQPTYPSPPTPILVPSMSMASPLISLLVLDYIFARFDLRCLQASLLHGEVP